MKPAQGIAQIIIVAVIALTLGAVVMFGHQKYLKKSPSSDQKTETANNSTQTADETAAWKTYNYKNLATFKYPPAWLTRDCSLEDNKTNNNFFLAPSQDLLGTCTSDVSDNLINISLTDPGWNLQQEIKGFSSHKLLQQNAIVGGQTAVKLSGTSQAKSMSNEVVGNNEPTRNKMIIYLIGKGDQTWIIGYSQSPQWIDYSSDFDKILSTFKFTN